MCRMLNSRSKALDAYRKKSDDSGMRQNDLGDDPSSLQAEEKSKARERQIGIYRRMTPAQRIETAVQLSVTARELKAAALRSSHPDWDEKRVMCVVRESFLYARS